MGKLRKKAGLIIINKDNKVLIGHPTNHSQTVWSLPKGLVEEGESLYDAAVRETYEETNVDFRDMDLKYTELSEQFYNNKKKSLVAFVIREDENDFDSSEFDLKCNSNVPDDASWNAGLPEMDDYRWVTLDEVRELLHYTQVAALNEMENGR